MAVRALKKAAGRDIMVLNSASVIQQLPAAGLRLLDGVPRSSWPSRAVRRAGRAR